MIHDVSRKVCGPYVFKNYGKTYHVISENLPEDYERIKFLHFYK